jgi:fatty-acyl-CoA synthase
VRINDDLPVTATNKILKRELIAAGVSAQAGVLWSRPARGTSYTVGLSVQRGA